MKGGTKSLLIIYFIVLTAINCIYSQPQKAIVVIYGSSRCESCHAVYETLKTLFSDVEFRDIGKNQTVYVPQYIALYEYLDLGKHKLIPLTLIFFDKKLVLVVVGSRSLGSWLRFLSKIEEGKVLVVREDGSESYVEVDQNLVYEIVFEGKIPTLPPKKEVDKDLIPMVLSLAVADSINPCTFLVFATLLIMVLRLSGRKRMLIAGIPFILAVFTAYFLLGLGLIEVLGYVPWMKKAVGILAICLGIFSLLNVRKGKHRAPIPAKWKDFVENKLYKIAMTGSPILGFVLGCLVSLTLLPCSGGPYIIALYLLSRLSFSTALSYLLIYNAIFVAPLVLILAVATIVAKAESLRRMYTKVPVVLDAVAGLLLIALGLYALL